MPIYEYKCHHCGHLFEKLQPVSAGHHLKCSRCGAEARRVISLSGFVLKGGGWYVTDHPSKARKAGMRSEKTKSSSPTESSPPPKAESKAAEKKES